MERPIECGHCKKSVKVLYKEIVDGTITLTEMCDDCPVLQQKLGAPSPSSTQNNTHLVCGHCKTSLESIIRGEPVGCAECYAIFKDTIISELIARGDIPERLVKNLKQTKTLPLHMGKSPGKQPSYTLSDQLHSLNASLNESLKRENYEQAAWLRDQIKALKEKTDDRKS